MRCEEFEARLNDLLDQRQQPNCDGQIARHARRCAACRDMLTVYGIVLEGIRNLEPPASADDLPAQVLAQLPDRCRLAGRLSQGKFYGSSLLWAGVAAAAVALLAPGGAVQPTAPTPETSIAAVRPSFTAPEIVASADAVAVEANENEAAPGLPAIEQIVSGPAVGALARQATTRYADLARDTSGALSHVRLLLPASLDGPRTPQVAVVESTTQQSLAEVAAGFRPLAESTAGAVHFLLNVLPVGPDATPPAAEQGANTQAI